MKTLETIATVLMALPALLYATGCLFATQVMVDMLPERIPGLQLLVKTVGAAFLGACRSRGFPHTIWLVSFGVRSSGVEDAALSPVFDSPLPPQIRRAQLFATVGQTSVG